MSQFEGNKRKVRCADCTKWVESRCVAKDVKVSPKKKRICPIYEFKGEYENRTPAEARYMPHVDKKTRRTIRKLVELGIIPVSEDGDVDMSGGYAKVKSLPMPSSTATAVDLGEELADDRLVQPVEKPPLFDLENPASKLLWTPDDENE